MITDKLPIFILIKEARHVTKRVYKASQLSDLDDVSTLKTENIMGNSVYFYNESYGDFKEWYDSRLMLPLCGSRRRIHVLGLGDVGSTFLIGLRLCGQGVVDEIGIYDLDENKLNRWEAEINQIYNDVIKDAPKVIKLKEEQLFDCDVFAFCASKTVPDVGKESVDVRKIQFDSNAKMIQGLTKKAVASKYKGIFCVVSDPVDQLCQVVLDESEGVIDADKIKGFGLGVMHARGRYLADRPDCVESFGPHGKGLIIANDVRKTYYDHEKSMQLTEEAETFNLQMRAWGYKPYVAPAISSAALSILEMIKGNYHHSTLFTSGVFLGVRNKYEVGGFVPMAYEMSETLYQRIEKTVTLLKEL